jgi:hypothetical protein
VKPKPVVPPFAQLQFDKARAQVKQNRAKEAREKAAAKKKKKNWHEGGSEASFEKTGPIGSGGK